MNNQFIYFLFTGGIAATTNFISRIILNNWLTFEVSVVISYIIGMIVAYILFRKLVFKSSVSIFSSSIKFVVVNLIGILLTYYVSVFMYSFLKDIPIPFTKEISHCIGILTPAITSFVGHKYFSFN